MSELDDLRFWKPKTFPLPERPKDPCKDGMVYPTWTRVWNIGNYKTGDDVCIVDKRAALAASGDTTPGCAEVYGEIAKIVAIIAPNDAIPFTPGAEPVVCMLELCNPDPIICRRILNTQLYTLQQLLRPEAEIQDHAPVPLYRDDSKYLCVLLESLQLDIDEKQHATPLLSTSTGFECVRGHDGYDYDGESLQYRTCFERNAFCIDKEFADVLVHVDACDIDDIMNFEENLPLYADYYGISTY